MRIFFFSLPLGEEGGDHRLDDDTRKMRRGIIKFLLLFTERERQRGGFVVVVVVCLCIKKEKKIYIQVNE